MSTITSIKETNQDLHVLKLLFSIKKMQESQAMRWEWCTLDKNVSWKSWFWARRMIEKRQFLSNSNEIKKQNDSINHTTAIS